MTPTEGHPLLIGEIIQLNPETVRNRAFAGCLMVVTEPKAFGCQGYVQALGDIANEMGGQAYYRAGWDEIERTGGMVSFMPERGTEES